MLCDICKKREPIIHIEGEGNFCLECHNRRMLKRYHVSDDFQYSRNITIMDRDGTAHAFQLQHMILGGIVSWEANEINGEYKVKHICNLGDDKVGQAQVFYQKIVDAVLTKTFDETGMMKTKGNIAIEEDQDGQICFNIDGETVYPENVAEALSPCVGFNIQYQIHDPSERILRENDYLMPVKISGSLLLGELREVIELYTDEEHFLKSGMVELFDHAFWPITDILLVPGDINIV